MQQDLSSAYCTPTPPLLPTIYYAWNEILGTPWLLLVFVGLVPFATYVITSFRFQYALFVNKNRGSSDLIIPVLPYCIPFLGHAIPVAMDSGAFVSRIM